MATAAATDVTCIDEFDSTQLSEAVDTAMMQLQGDKGWFTQLKTSTGYHNAASVNSCTPGDQWKYPKEADAKGLLRRVLTNGEIRVGGVQWSKGEQADYKTDPDNPTGFWCAARHANRESRRDAPTTACVVELDSSPASDSAFPAATGRST